LSFKKPGAIRLAHFSDIHLGRADGDLEVDIDRMCGLIDHAIEAGAQHLLFGGDIVDHGNVDDAKALRRHLKKRGFLDGERFSFVPGNHDIWPFGEGAIGEGAMAWMVGNVKAMLTASAWPAQARYDKFAETFKEAFDGTDQLYDSDSFPAFKRVGPLGIGMLDTTSDRGAFASATGRFEPDEADWLNVASREHAGPSILLMHQWPFRVAIDFDAESLPWIVRKPLEALGIDVAEFVDVNFEELAKVRRFVQRGPFKAVLCGHIPLMSDDLEDAEFDQKLGKVPVHCMGRSGGVHQDPDDPWLGYHLVDADSKKVKVDTVLVEASDVA
jgi:hypothetical protein